MPTVVAKLQADPTTVISLCPITKKFIKQCKARVIFSEAVFRYACDLHDFTVKTRSFRVEGADVKITIYTSYPTPIEIIELNLARSHDDPPITPHDVIVSPYVKLSDGSASVMALTDAKLTFELKGNATRDTIRTRELTIGPKTFRESFGWGFSNMFRRNFNAICSPYKSMVIECTITVTTNGPSELLEDFRSFYEAKAYSDITIHVGQQTFRAHRLVLAARSAVFAAMLASGLKEAKTGEIHILDLQPRVVESMLQYIYTGDVEDIDDIAEDLLVAADKYGLVRLKIMCEQFLTANLAVENVARVFQLADMHGLDQLKSQAVYFISCNIVEVQQSQGWNDLKESNSKFLVEEFIEYRPSKRQRTQ